MKIIYVIVPTNNRKMLNKEDLQPFKSSKDNLIVAYPDTRLDQLNTMADVIEVLPLMKAAITAAKEDGAAAIIINGFGDVGITKENEHDEIPMVGLGRIVVRELSKISKGKFTVLPAQPGHEAFIEGLIIEEDIKNYIRAPAAIGLQPKEIRTSESALEALFTAACAAIDEEGVDSISVACASFFGLADKLQQMLCATYKKEIHVIDPLKVTLQYVRNTLLVA
jgi:Asp/Glu/hydantoin racemase